MPPKEELQEQSPEEQDVTARRSAISAIPAEAPITAEKFNEQYLEFLNLHSSGEQPNMKEANALRDQYPQYTPDLRGKDLSDKNLYRLNLKKARLDGARMFNVNLLDASLQGANMTNAFLANATFANADVTGAQMGGANLRGANLNVIKGLTPQMLAGTIFIGAKYNKRLVEEALGVIRDSIRR